MLKYITIRLLNMVLVAFLISIIVFTILYLIPGDPATVILGANATPEQLEAVRERMGLKEPFHIRYLHWLERLLQGDMGNSYINREPVTQLIGRAFPITLQLTVSGLSLAVLIAVPLGTLAATKRGTLIDLAISFTSFAGLSVPVFWLAIMLVQVFSIKLRWFPSTGYVSPSENLLLNLKGMVLPAVCLGIFFSTELIRYMRDTVIRVFKEDHILTARSKGVRERTILLRHVIRNALIPFVTVLGLQFAYLLAGAAIIETVFAIPGMGSLSLNAIFSRDYEVVAGFVLVMAIVYVVINTAVDILYFILDPRLLSAYS